tara:strand:- start:41 stop:1495 length:1455 start_codon:yes stop_codon:yes gene_type:complete
MSELSLPVLKKTDPTGVGVSRAAVLYKVIKEGTPIELVSGGKKAIQARSNEILDALKKAGDTTDDGAHATLKRVFSGKKPLKYITKNGTVEIRLSDIEKTEMFGSNKGSGGGARGTALQESAAAWFSAVRFSLNKDITEQPTDKQFDAVASLVSTDKSLDEIKEFLEENNDWVESCCATANKLYKKFGKKNGYNWYRGGSFVDSINAHFKKVNTSYDTPPFANLNKWTPADIWACECSFDKSEMRETTKFSSFNAYLKKAIDDEILFGISLKKTASSEIKITEVNYDKSRPTFSFDSIYAKSFESLDMWMYITGISVQFRDTSGGSGLQWQGEAVGSKAKHGKIGGGVYSGILEEVTGEPLYTNIDLIKTDARSGKLKDDVLQLSIDYTNKVVGAESGQKGVRLQRIEDVTKLSGRAKEEKLREMINQRHNETNGQWTFSKYLGLLMVDRLMNMTDTDRHKFSNLVGLYATSQHRDSAPFLKAS